MNKHIKWLFLVNLYLTCESLNAASITGIDLQFSGDSNPAKAEFTRDIESTTAAKGRVTGNLFSKSLAENKTRSSAMSINASASYEHNATITELGESRYRVSLDWFLENKIPVSQPFYRLSVGLGYLDSETQIRDSAVFDVSGSINYQPTNFFDTTVGIRAELRNADTRVFDTTKTTLFITGNFSPFSRMVLRAGLRYVIGDEISTATPTLNIVNNAQIIEPDPAFGGVEENRFAISSMPIR